MADCPDIRPSMCGGKTHQFFSEYCPDEIKHSIQGDGAVHITCKGSKIIFLEDTENNEADYGGFVFSLFEPFSNYYPQINDTLFLSVTTAKGGVEYSKTLHIEKSYLHDSGIAYITEGAETKSGVFVRLYGGGEGLTAIVNHDFPIANGATVVAELTYLEV